MGQPTPDDRRQRRVPDGRKGPDRTQVREEIGSTIGHGRPEATGDLRPHRAAENGRTGEPYARSPAERRC